MKGLEISRRYFREIVSPLIDTYVPTIADAYAGGLIGYGSDVLGHDDEVSQDHCWGPRCFIWLRPEDYGRCAAELQAVFDRELPLEFLGHSTQFEVDGHGLYPITSGERGIHQAVLTTVPRYLKLRVGLEEFPPTSSTGCA